MPASTRLAGANLRSRRRRFASPPAAYRSFGRAAVAACSTTSATTAGSSALPSRPSAPCSGSHGLPDTPRDSSRPPESSRRTGSSCTRAQRPRSGCPSSAPHDRGAGIGIAAFLAFPITNGSREPPPGKKPRRRGGPARDNDPVTSHSKEAASAGISPPAPKLPQGGPSAKRSVRPAASWPCRRVPITRFRHWS